MASPVAPLTLAYECDPLSHPFASFNGHTRWRTPSKQRTEDMNGEAESSKTAQLRAAETALRDNIGMNGWEKDDDQSELKASTIASSRLRK